MAADPLGASPEDLVFVDNATTGVNAVLQSLAWPEGAEVVTTVQVYPAVRNALRHRLQQVGGRLVEAGLDAMYVAHYADDMILRVDPKTNAATSSEAVCDGPQAMAVLEGKVWVTCTLSHELVALDATTLQKVASVPVEGSPDSVLATPEA